MHTLRKSVAKRPPAAMLVLALCTACQRHAPATPPAPPTPAASSRAVTAPPDAAAATAFYANTFQKTPSVAALTAMGRALFFAPELSRSGTQACASCHQPGVAFGPPNDRAVQLGGADGRSSGLRAVPSLRYLQLVPPFNEHYQDSDGDGTDQGPAGGFAWDGRAPSAHDQARLPLFSPLEMANGSPAELVARLRGSPLAARLRDTFGDEVLADSERGLKALLLALEAFEQSPADFYPYDSKYDAVLRHKAQLTPTEARGLALFNDPKKGNCATCHPSQIKEGGFPQFTDYGFIALGVPRNRAIPANADPAYFDLGLCGPLRTDYSRRADYCGLFRTPSLRNVALRRRFFHNGAVTDLRDAVRFYAERDLHPERWYPRGRDGTLVRFDDLPPQYHGNINRDPPFGPRPAALTPVEIDAIVAFLGTLSDGYRPR
jgi:cytochrome c peroxidase